MVRDKSPAELIRRTRNYWQLWVTHEARDFGGLPPEVVERYRQSLLIIRSQIDAGGAVLAANDSDIVRFNRDTYSYAWPRDGALVSVALLRAGQPVAAERFLEFCARVISPEGFVRHKYNPDGTLASSWHGYVRDGKPVLPIQEDETALVVWAVGEYFDQSRRVDTVGPFYRPLVTRPGDFLLGYVDTRTGLPLPSYDLWEERWGVHLFTVAAVIAGLRAAARLARAFGEEERAGRYVAGADRMLQAARAVMWSERDGRFVRMVTPRSRRLSARPHHRLERVRPRRARRAAARRPTGAGHDAEGRGAAPRPDGRRRPGALRERHATSRWRNRIRSGSPAIRGSSAPCGWRAIT